jgi:Na+/H+ antiporter NhaC
MEHVGTQIPYAAFIAVCSFIGFLVGGLSMNAVFAWIAALAAFVVGNIILPKVLKVK